MTSEIIRFANKEEYLKWLDWKSWAIKEKAAKFHQKYGDDVVPVIISIDGDEWCESGGCNVFVHPDHINEVLKSIVF